MREGSERFTPKRATGPDSHHDPTREALIAQEATAAVRAWRQEQAAEAVDHGYEDAVSQAGIDIGEFIVDLVKKNPMMELNADTLKDVTSSALTSLTLYIEDPDSPFQEERED